MKNSSEKLDDMKKVTIIKTLLVPKVVYTSLLLPTPEHIMKELNHLIYTFLWKGKDKVTRASAINNYEGGGIKLVDVESMIKSLRLSWLKRIFGDNSGAWKNYLKYLLKELIITSKTLLLVLSLVWWWCEIREDNAFGNKNWHYFIWNNQEIRKNNKPIFYEKYFNVGIRAADNLRFDLSNLESYELIAKKNIKRRTFWNGLVCNTPYL